mmetsp:Transcript_28683/g.48398  ORF Transcript_28683/g.48398 Transcript_28683/m.48398 type:complete len:300 (+) Transcript_28683:16-915(+)
MRGVLAHLFFLTLPSFVMGDILFQTLEKWHGGKEVSWGRFLDAGTGVGSLRWAQTQIVTSSITAITADVQMQRQVMSDPHVNPLLRTQDQVLVGNWMDDSFCSTLGLFDTILADYLIGAVDGFSPYTQDIIVEKLSQYLNPGGKIYIIGMNPIPDTHVAPAAIVSEVRRARDSCILLAGQKPYREFPLEWMTRHLEKSNFDVLNTATYSILHSEDSITRQLRVAELKLDFFLDSNLRSGMQRYLDGLRSRIQEAVRGTETKKIPLSFDYCIAAQLKNDTKVQAVECDSTAIIDTTQSAV